MFDQALTTYRVAELRHTNFTYCLFLTILVISAIVICGGASLVARKKLEGAIEDALTDCSNCMKTAGLRLSDNMQLDAEQRLAATLRTITDAFLDLKKHDKAMVDKAVDMVCWLDDTGKFREISPSCMRITGYTPQELINTPLLDYLDNDKSTNAADSLHLASKSSDLSVFENWFISKDGRQVCLRWSAHWSVSESLLFAIAHDITEIKNAQQQLKGDGGRTADVVRIAAGRRAGTRPRYGN